MKRRKAFLVQLPTVQNEFSSSLFRFVQPNMRFISGGTTSPDTASPGWVRHYWNPLLSHWPQRKGSQKNRWPAEAGCRSQHHNSTRYHSLFSVTCHQETLTYQHAATWRLHESNCGFRVGGTPRGPRRVTSFSMLLWQPN